MDSGCAPGEVFCLHRSDERTQFGCNDGVTDAATLAGPIAPKPLTVSAHDRVWMQGVKHGPPVINVVCERNPEELVHGSHSRSFDRAFEKGDLLTKR